MEVFAGSLSVEESFDEVCTSEVLKQIIARDELDLAGRMKPLLDLRAVEKTPLVQRLISTCRTLRLSSLPQGHS